MNKFAFSTGGNIMKRMSLFFVFVFFAAIISLSASVPAYADPKISNCDISPKQIKQNTEVGISFDYENVEGGLKNGKVILNQKIQLPGEEKVVMRVSNWQTKLEDLSAYTSESGRFEKKFTNPDIWRGPGIELTYELKILDRNGRESNTCTARITPK
jgi:hypothetical protein